VGSVNNEYNVEKQVCFNKESVNLVRSGRKQPYAELSLCERGHLFGVIEVISARFVLSMLGLWLFYLLNFKSIRIEIGPVSVLLI